MGTGAGHPHATQGARERLHRRPRFEITVTDMAIMGSIAGGPTFAPNLAPTILAAILLGSIPFQAGAQAPKAFELVHWNPHSPQFKGKETCLVTGEAVKCTGTFAVGSVSGGGNFTGKVRGDTWTGRSDHRGQDSNPNCQLVYEGTSSAVITLKTDGTIETTTTDRTDTYSSVSGPCAPFMPKTSNSPGPVVTVGTWRELSVGTEPTIAVAPDADGKSSVRIEGNTIYVADGSGTERVVALVSPTKGPPPTFSTPGAGDLGDALQRFLAPQLWVANPPPLPAGQGGNYVIAAPLSGEGIGDAIAAAGESVVNWVTGNSTHRNLIVLGAGISMAFSHSTFAGAVDGSGATVGKQIIGGIMVAGVTGFVKSLANTFLTDKSGLQRTGEALAKGGGEAAGSIFGNALGGVTPAAVNVFRQGISQTALKLVSQGVNVATDAVVQKLQVSEKTAALVMKAPSYASSLLTLPGPSPETGGMSLNFDR
jgi:hypothetical protein